MYYAKNAGRNRFESFHPLLNTSLTHHESESMHHLDDLPMHFRSAEIITLDEQPHPESLLEAFGEHPVLGSTSFEVLKKFATDRVQHFEVELKLIEQAFTLINTNNLKKYYSHAQA